MLRTVRAAMLHVLRHRAFDGPLLDDHAALRDYLLADMAHDHVECVRVLFLNIRNRLLRDEIVAQGTIDQAPIYPREIIRRALDVGATALILIHNHPSGDPHPSRGDIAATRQLQAAAKPFSIVIHDHLIVARGGWKSFREEGLL